MVTTTQTKAGEASPFELKGSLFTLTVLHLRQTDLQAIDRHLAAKIDQAPGFFQNVPVIIDLEQLAADVAVNFLGLYDLLRNRGMIPVAVRNGSDEQQQAAIAAKLPTLPAARAPLASNPIEPGESDAPAQPAAVKARPSTDNSDNSADSAEGVQRPHYRLHSQPVRSGQRIYAPAGDLILLGPISAGAEVIADGNIHAYAPMRGRALAGVNGDQGARIFCQILEAELVAIAGTYRVIEQKDTAIWGQRVQVYLAQEERLIIEPLSR